MTQIHKIGQLGHIKSLPKNLLDLCHNYPLCKIAAAPKVPRFQPKKDMLAQYGRAKEE